MLYGIQPVGFTLILLSLIALSTLPIAIFKKKFEEVIPFTIISIIFFLYWFSLFDVLEYGFYILLTIVIISPFIAYYIAKNNIIIFYKNTLSIGLLVYIILSCFIAFILQNSFIYVWDDFSHWGLTARDMYYTSKIIPRFYPDYPIGTRLFQYFILKIYGNFSESILITYFYLFYFSLAIYPLKEAKIKHLYFIIIYSCLILIFPTTIIFFEDTAPFQIFTFLMVDIILASVLGYTIFFIIKLKQPIKNIEIIEILLLLFALIMIKAVGILLAICCIALFAILSNQTKYTILLTILVTLFKASWSVYTTIHHYSTYLHTRLISNVEKIMNGTFTLPNFANKFFTIYYQAIIHKPLIIYFSYLHLVILLSIICILLFIILRQHRVLILKTYISLAIGLIFFTMGHIFGYLGTFHTSESMRLASFERYLNIVFVAFIFILILLFTTYYLFKILFTHKLISSVFGISLMNTTLPFLIGVLLIGSAFTIYNKRSFPTQELNERLNIVNLSTIVYSDVKDNEIVFFGTHIPRLMFQYTVNKTVDRVVDYSNSTKYIVTYKTDTIHKDIQEYLKMKNIYFKGKLEDYALYKIEHNNLILQKCLRCNK